MAATNSGFSHDGVSLNHNSKNESENRLEEINLEHGLEIDLPDAKTNAGKLDMLYTIEDTPPWYLSVLLGLQHYLTMVGATIAIPLILTPALCIQPENPARVHLVSTIFFTSGIATFLQATFGVRLPIVQGGTFALLTPALAILHTQYPSCSSYNFSNMTLEEQDEVWMPRMQGVQGAIVVASLFEIFIGVTGIIGSVVSVVTPLAIAPTVTLVGLSLFDIAADKAATQWGIAMLTIFLMALFSQYLRNVKVPLPGTSRGLNIFGLFPVLLSLLFSWTVCGIITASVDLPLDSSIRTDKAFDIIRESPWIRVPYPGQWGWPSVTVAGVFGILAGLLASVVESIGDYYACARLSGAPPLPMHAINRGIGIEGLGSLLAGLFGTGNGTTSYGENIGAIGLTKVGSRRVIQFSAAIMMIFGIFSKVAAVFVGIPDPVVGGLFCVMFGMVTAVGLSNIQYVDMNSPRNIFVLGFSIFFGLAFPKWLEGNPDILVTESFTTLSQIVSVLLRTPMFVGGFLGIILDNTIPGTPEERGLIRWKAQLNSNVATDSEGEIIGSNYDLPFGMDGIRRVFWFSKVPICPTFQGFDLKNTRWWKRMSSCKCFTRN